MSVTVSQTQLSTPTQLSEPHPHCLENIKCQSDCFRNAEPHSNCFGQSNITNCNPFGDLNSEL